MTNLSQPSPAPINTPSTAPARTNKLPTISLITAIASIVLFIVPFLGLGLGIVATITGFKSVLRDGPTKKAYVGAIIGTAGLLFGLCWLIVIAIFGVSLGRGA